MINRMNIRKFLVFRIVFLFGATQCIGLKSGLVPDESKWVAPKKEQINVAVEYNYSLETIDPVNRGRRGIRAEIYHNRMLRALYKTGIPYKVAIHRYWQPGNEKKKIYLSYLDQPKQEKNPEYFIYFDLKQIEHANALDFLWAVVCGGSFTIIPMRQRETFILSMKVLDPKGKEVFNKQYSDDAVAWIQLLLLPATPFLWPFTVEDEVAENLFSVGLKEFYEKQKL